MKELCNNPNEDPGTNLVLSFMSEQLKGHSLLKKAVKMDKITSLGASYSRPLSIEERYVFAEFVQRDDVEDDAKFFTKAVVNGASVLHCVNYRRKSLDFRVPL